MISVRISPATFRRLTKLAADFAKVQNQLNDRSRPHRKIRDNMAKRWAVNFDSQGQEYGDTWLPTQQSTIDLHGPPRATLRRTGALRSSFISQAKAGSVEPDASRWKFERRPIYMFAMHFGWPGNKLFNPHGSYAPIPARPMWNIDGKDEDMAHDELEEYIDSVINKHFS